MFRNLVCSFAVLWSATLITTAQAEESLAERRARVEAMSAADKETLKRKQEYFARLTLDEQTRLRKLHGELNAGSTEEVEKLKSVLERYHTWLNTLSPLEKSELLDLPPEKRIERIKQLTKKQEVERFRALANDSTTRLTNEDRDAMRKWLGEFVETHKETIPMERRNYPDNERGKWELARDLKNSLFGQWWREDAKIPRPTPQDVDTLKAKLSSEVQAILEKEKNQENRSKLVQVWVSAAERSRFQPPPVTDDELTEFYKTKLSAAERERLDALQPGEMKAELLKLYYQSMFRGPGGNNPWQGRGGGGRGSRGGGERGERGEGGGRRGGDDRGEGTENKDKSPAPKDNSTEKKKND